jgi:hypothetical protein
VLVIQFLDVTKFAQDTFDKHWILCWLIVIWSKAVKMIIRFNYKYRKPHNAL